MGRKHIVPYGLRSEGYVSAKLANTPGKGTGFSGGLGPVLWDAGQHVRARPFGGTGQDGEPQAGSYSSTTATWAMHRRTCSSSVSPSNGGRVTAPRSFADYVVTVNKAGLTAGVELIEKL